MKKLLITLAIVGLALTVPTQQAQAIFIVDTGPGPNSIFGAPLHDIDVLYQYLAGQFTTTESYNIHSLEGWIGGQGGGTISTVIYGDNANTVNKAEEIFRQSVILPGLSGDTLADWRGVTGLNLPLSPGTYWLAFEPPHPGFEGAMPFPVGSPLNNYAHQNADTLSNYITSNTNSLGFRIDASVIPEPATMLLFGSGLVGGAFIRRKRRA